MVTYLLTRVDNRAFKIIAPNERYYEEAAAVFQQRRGARGSAQRDIKINCNHKILDARVLFLSPTCALADSRRKIPARLGAGLKAEGEPGARSNGVSLVNRGRVNRGPSVNQSCRYEKR